MPTVINGIGTWYYGKRRIHSRKGTCESCGRQADLVSFDTTLFVVVVFVPVIPLQRKRILNQCSAQLADGIAPSASRSGGKRPRRRTVPTCWRTCVATQMTGTLCYAPSAFRSPIKTNRC